MHNYSEPLEYNEAKMALAVKKVSEVNDLFRNLTRSFQENYHETARRLSQQDIDLLSK
jgi:hypothetical protein